MPVVSYPRMYGHVSRYGRYMSGRSVTFQIRHAIIRFYDVIGYHLALINKKSKIKNQLTMIKLMVSIATRPPLPSTH